MQFPSVLYKHISHVISNFSVRNFLSEITRTSDRCLGSDRNKISSTALFLGFLKGNFAEFWCTVICLSKPLLKKQKHVGCGKIASVRLLVNIVSNIGPKTEP